MKFRYHTNGSWYKGNTHIHSTASDGGKTFPELAELYAGEKYDFLFRTDHWVCSDVKADPLSYPLLWIDGIELDGHDHTGTYFHVVCLGRVEGICRDNGFESALKSAREQGALTVLAHPYWTANSLDDCLRWEFDGVEGYNHVCHWLNGKSNGMVHWDAALMQDSAALAFSADDAHLRAEHRTWNGGWIMVNAHECTQESILSAIRYGNYYSSCGPAFTAIEFDGESLHVQTSPVRFARLVGPGAKGSRLNVCGEKPVRAISFQVPSGWDYMYLEIEDMEGRKAWTNALFVNDARQGSGQLSVSE